MRFSAAPQGPLGDRTVPWAVFGERPGDPDGLEANALAALPLATVAGAPGAPIFEPVSLFGAHMAALPLDLAPGEPVVVCVHGFCHEPRRPVVARVRSDNPHRTLFHFAEPEGGPGGPEERALARTPWFARALVPGGSGPEAEARGLAVGFAYPSYGGADEPFLPGWGGRLAMRLAPPARWRRPGPAFERAYMDAEQAGFALAGVLKQVAARLDHAGLTEQPIDILAHGLGARVVMSALALLARRAPEDRVLARIERVVMMGAALYWGQAAHGLASILFSEVWPRPQFFNVMSGQDGVLAAMERRRTAPSALKEAVEDLSLDPRGARALRRGRVAGRSGKPPHALYDFFGPDYPDWVDLPLDDPAVRAWARRQGLDLKGDRAGALGDHAVYFTHPGNWELYRRVLHRREGWSAGDLDTALWVIG